jgi:uncharacterized surface protein with fasciclin (FAS1) repeats
MLNPRKLGRSRGLAAAALIGAIALAGCSGTEDEPQGSGAGDTTSSPAPSASPASDAPFGPACASVPAESLAAIADDPVATAASQAPALSTLVTAVTKAGLVETLNGAQDITLFAPTNEAFAKIPKATLDQVLADKQALTNILTYHVVEERRSPDELETATLPTLQGGTISTAKSGETYTANDASVVCGNVQTGNATVYLIDTVLMPKS